MLDYCGDFYQLVKINNSFSYDADMSILCDSIGIEKLIPNVYKWNNSGKPFFRRRLNINNFFFPY